MSLLFCYMQSFVGLELGCGESSKSIGLGGSLNSLGSAERGQESQLLSGLLVPSICMMLIHGSPNSSNQTHIQGCSPLTSWKETMTQI